MAPADFTPDNAELKCVKGCQSSFSDDGQFEEELRGMLGHKGFDELARAGACSGVVSNGGSGS